MIIRGSKGRSPVSGIQEILVLVIIILAIFFVPRMMNKREHTKPSAAVPTLSGRLRLAIAASIFWPVLMAAFLKPWHQDPAIYLYIAVGPVACAWCIYWVSAGFRKK